MLSDNSVIIRMYHPLPSLQQECFQFVMYIFMLYVSLFPGNLIPMSQLSDQEDSNDTETNRVAGEYNETVPQMPPRFTRPGNMNRVVAKPAGNMLRLKCPAEGKQCCIHS